VFLIDRLWRIDRLRTSIASSLFTLLKLVADIVMFATMLVATIRYKARDGTFAGMSFFQSQSSHELGYGRD
jgi:hypothetical protein